MDNVINLHTSRNDIAALTEEIKDLIYDHKPSLSLAEAIGVLEIIKIELYSYQVED